MKAPAAQFVTVELSKDTNYTVKAFTELLKSEYLKNTVNAGHSEKFENSILRIDDFSDREVGDEFTDKKGKRCKFWESDFFEDNAGRLKAYLLTTYDSEKWDKNYPKTDDNTCDREDDHKFESNVSQINKIHDSYTHEKILNHQTGQPNDIPRKEIATETKNDFKNKIDQTSEFCSENFEHIPLFNRVKCLMDAEKEQKKRQEPSPTEEKSDCETKPQNNSSKKQLDSKISQQLADSIFLIPSKASRRVRRQELSLHDLVTDIPIIERTDIAFSGRKLGQGGQASVYHGIWKRTEVALKTFEKSSHSYLGLREVILLSKIKHPGVILPMAIAEGITEYVIVLEYFNSVSPHQVIFSSHIKDSYSLDMLQKLFIAKQLCEILYFLHTEKEPVIHRDIKPGNILLEWTQEQRLEYKIKVCDLGMRKCRSLRSELQTSNTNKCVRGPTFYNSPELIKRLPFNTKTDVWSTACTLVELFTEEPVWPDEDGHGVRERIWRNEIPVLGSVPMFLNEILPECFEYDTNRRCEISKLLDIIDDKFRKVKATQK